MKLTTPSGELTLPADFSFEIEQNSAFFSEDGTASVAATIPATPADKAKLGFPDRLGRKTKFINSFPAILQHGVFQKSGVLVITGASDNSITGSIALEDSSFYSQHKDKNLKELFSTKVDERYSTPAAWYGWLWQVYKLEIASDFRLFPVAVNYDSEAGTYQMNNEPVYASATYDSIWPLAHSPRIIKENGEDVSVPEGYGIAPFLKLNKFLEYMFELCGYSVGSSCFVDDTFLNNLVLLHNCSDVICNGKISYADLVPNCTIADILEWLQQKFHAQIVVDPSTKVIDIILLEMILKAPFDMNISSKAIGSLSKKFEPASRVVMTPDTSLDGASAAADTISSLIAKYGYIKSCDESLFSSIITPCVVHRLATGDYYEIRLSGIKSYGRGSSPVKKVKIGTNQFRYDRANSEASEEFEPADLIPPMVFADSYGTLAPYIGARTHRNTSYNDSSKDEDQDIIIVYYAGLSEKPTYEYSGRVPTTSGGKYYFGTTQKYNNRGNLIDGAIELTPEGIVNKYFSLYNKHLRNNAVSVSGEFKLTIEEIFRYDLYRMKLIDGQLMLPVSLKYEVGRQLRCLQADFRLIKDYSDGDVDEPIEIPEPIYEWSLNQSEITAKSSALAAEYSGQIRWNYDSSDEYVSGDKDIFLPAPRYLGEVSPSILRQIYFYSRVYSPNGRDYTDRAIGVFALNEWFDAVLIS